LTFDLFNWKLALHLLMSWETFIPISLFYVFDLRAYTDRQTDGQARCIMQQIVSRHNQHLLIFSYSCDI